MSTLENIQQIQYFFDKLNSIFHSKRNCAMHWPNAKSSWTCAKLRQAIGNM